MNHYSIAILRKKSALEESSHLRFRYLVLVDANNECYFFERVNTSFGGNFDFTNFKRAIYRYFELDGKAKRESVNEVDFETLPQPFKQSKRDPFATSYIYDLSAEQEEIIVGHLNSGEPKWKHCKWIEESELKSHRWKTHQQFLFSTEEPFKQPEFTNEFRADLNKIVEAKNNGKLVIFAGAGISYDSNVPDWSQLIDQLKADLTTSKTDFPEIAQQYYDERGHKEYYDKLVEVLKFGKTTYNPVHKKITDLSPIHVITTNYDAHFEQVIAQKALAYSTIRMDSDLPFAKGNSLYVKMHGDLGVKRVVLKKSDYKRYSRDFPLIESFIKETFASKLVLFLGFSFDDKNLQKILKTVQQILKSNIQRPYLFAGSVSNEMKKERWFNVEKSGVKIMTYNSALKDYFNQISLEEDVDNLKLIKKRSQEVYTFLRVIEDFDPSSDGLDNLEIQKQLVHSLFRFDGLSAIPIQILTSISPFKLKKQPRYDSSGDAEYSAYQPFHLQTANEELLAFLKKIRGSKKHVEYNITIDPDLSLDEQNLHRVFRILENSGIECITRKNDTSTEHFKLEGVNGKIKCNCMRCLARNLELRDLLGALNTSAIKAICDGDQMNEKLLEAYAYYKTGQPVKCYYALEAAKNKSVKEQKYITYFIASLNQSKIFNFITFHHESNVKPEQIEDITQKLTRLDIYELLNKLPVEKIVRQSLRYVLENRVYHDALKSINEEFEQIKDNYAKHRKPWYRVHGPVVWQNFQARFFLVWNFYHQNLLFEGDTYEFHTIARWYIEGMLASYATSIRYSERLNYIPKFFNEIAIHHGYPSGLNDLFKKYRIDKLDQFNDDKSLLVNFHSFLESSYDRNNFFGESINRNILFDGLANTSYYFEQKTTSFFNNQLVLLQHFKLTKDEVNLTVDKIVNFLSFSEAFGAANSFVFVTSFFSRYIKEIDDARITKIMQFGLSDNIWPAGIINPLCKSLLGINRRNFIGKELFLQVRNRIGNRSEWPMRVRDAVPLYPFWIAEQQKEFRELFREHSSGEQLPFDLIRLGYEWGMWNPIDDPKIFEQLFISVVDGISTFGSYKITKSGHPLGKDFSYWNKLYFTLKLLYRHDHLNSEIGLQLYEKTDVAIIKWILRPEKFDYKQFKLRWALTFANPNILKTTRQLPQLLSAIQKKLKKKFNRRIAEIYFTS